VEETAEEETKAEVVLVVMATFTTTVLDSTAEEEVEDGATVAVTVALLSFAPHTAALATPGIRVECK